MEGVQKLHQLIKIWIIVKMMLRAIDNIREKELLLRSHCKAPIYIGRLREYQMLSPSLKGNTIEFLWRISDKEKWQLSIKNTIK